MFSQKQLKKARRRDGEADPDRSDDVEELLTPNERLGWREGTELLDKPYREYPQHDQVLRPAARDDVVELAEHPLVTSIEDIAAELSTDETTIRRAFDLHDLAAPTQSDVEVTTDRLDGLTDLPERMITPDNPILLATLYVDHGLSVGEIQEVIDVATDDTLTVYERSIRQALVDAKVIDGVTSAEEQRRRQQSRGDVTNGGMTIRSEDI